MPEDAKQRIHVAVAVIEENGCLLVAKRPLHLHMGGYWEFPGGKVEAGESVQEALVRELNEELGIRCESFSPLIKIPFNYPDKNVLLDVWHVSNIQGQATGCEGQEVQWININSLNELRFPAANKAIIHAIKLPNRYVITPEMDDKQTFIRELEQTLSTGIGILQLRCKQLKKDDYITLSEEVLKLCQRYSCQLLLNGEPELLDIIDADGIHLGSKLAAHYDDRPIVDEKLLSIACHDYTEIDKANQLHADLALLSPVRQTASHPDVSPLGWEQFQQLSDQASMPVYALGGIDSKDIDNVRKHGGQGVAGISGFWIKKGGEN